MTLDSIASCARSRAFRFRAARIRATRFYENRWPMLAFGLALISCSSWASESTSEAYRAAG